MQHLICRTHIIFLMAFWLLLPGVESALSGERLSNIRHDTAEVLPKNKNQSDKRKKIDEQSPSKAQYFSWINNTNEGPTEQQTLINLDFFEWLRSEYAMQLDIYAFDAGTIDDKRWYGSINSDRFKTQFPAGFDPVFKKATSLGIRLGVWGGPDGFGTTPAEEKARTEQMVSLCKDYNFALFKFDSVAGQLRDDKQDAFATMMQTCREYTPDLILLNHRLNLGEVGTPHATTFLWEGKETYIDVHLWNESPAIHSRAGALARGLPPKLSRLTEDHGVCLSNALDYWDDELILQAFNRALILSPQIYCNPWFLRDDEYPKLARIFNLAKQYADILVDGIILPEEHYGPSAVSRGDQQTRLITVRNLTWDNATYSLTVDETIGLAKPQNPQTFEVRQYHAGERILGDLSFGEKMNITVPPFRSALIRITPSPEIQITGVSYEMIKDVPDQDMHVRLIGNPGDRQKAIIQNKEQIIHFPGKPYKLPFHRKIADLAPTKLPDDAQALYETTIYAASNDALEVQAIERSGPSNIDSVRAARRAFFEQRAFIDRGLWDRYMFDGDPETAFYRSERWLYNWNLDPDSTIAGGALRVDFGKIENIGRLVLKSPDIASLQPLKLHEGIIAEVSTDLNQWHEIRFLADTTMELKMPAPGFPVRYLRLAEAPQSISEIEAYAGDKLIHRDHWQGSNLFGAYSAMDFNSAWTASFTLDEIAPDSYLTIAVPGKSGHESVYAALRVGNHIIGAPKRAPAYPANSWELQVKPVDGNYSYYIPIKPEWAGNPMEVVLLTRKGAKVESAQAWISRKPIPLATHDIKLPR